LQHARVDQGGLDGVGAGQLAQKGKVRARGARPGRRRRPQRRHRGPHRARVGRLLHQVVVDARLARGERRRLRGRPAAAQRSDRRDVHARRAQGASVLKGGTRHRAQVVRGGGGRDGGRRGVDDRVGRAVVGERPGHHLAQARLHQRRLGAFVLGGGRGRGAQGGGEEEGGGGGGSGARPVEKSDSAARGRQRVPGLVRAHQGGQSG
jgi:hypothetical protein